jgi:hypothetical protein
MKLLIWWMLHRLDHRLKLLLLELEGRNVAPAPAAFTRSTSFVATIY